MYKQMVMYYEPKVQFEAVGGAKRVHWPLSCAVRMALCI